MAQALALVIDTEAPFEYPHAWQNVSGSQKRTNGSQNVKYSSSRHIRFRVSDTAQAARILECIFHENQFTIQDDHKMQVYNVDLPIGKIVTAFVENGLEVSEATTSEESLEDYFKRVTGGEGIA